MYHPTLPTAVESGRLRPNTTHLDILVRAPRLWRHGVERVAVVLPTLTCPNFPFKTRITFLVRNGKQDVERCRELCRPELCACRAEPHPNIHEHLNIARFARGDHHLLYLHGDAWLKCVCV